MKNALCFLLLLVLVFPGVSAGQEKLTLDLRESIRIALQQNPEILIAEKEVARANAGVGEAWATVLPQLDASANFSHNWKIQSQTIPNFLKPMLGALAPPGMPDFVSIAFALKNTLSYGATVTQPLFLGGAGIAGIQTAYAARRAAEFNLEAKKQELIHQVANVFYSSLLARELIQVQDEALQQAKANLAVVTKKYEVGMASGFDKMRAEVDVANLQPEVITARNNYQAALTGLRNILGLPSGTDIDISGEFHFVEDDFSHLTLGDLQKLARQNRPEIQALQQQKRISQSEITIARSNFLPKVYFSTDYSFLAFRNDLKFSREDFSEGFTSAISLQIPLFHGFRTARQYQKAKLDHKIILDSEKQLRDGIFAEVEVAYHSFHEARQKYVSTQKTVTLAEEALRLANLMYEEGANTQLDVLNSQLALTRARMNYVTSLYEYQISRYQLRKVTGTLRGILP